MNVVHQKNMHNDKPLNPEKSFLRVTSQSLRSDNAVKVTNPYEVLFVDDKHELLSVPPAEVLYDMLISGSASLGGRTFRSMKSEMSPGFVTFSSLTSSMPISIFTTVDMDGRSFGVSCVHRRAIFKNRQASSAS